MSDLIGIQEFGKDTNVLSKDLIRRQDAIDAVDIGNLHRGIVDALQSIMSELPSAVKHGHWVWKKPSDDCRCSNCGKIADQKYPYCPWCGADMRGEEDG